MKMRRGRLRTLIKELRKDAHNKQGMRFDLSLWLNFLHSGKADCGTTGCAIGLALLIPAFNKEGFRPKNSLPSFRTKISWEAVEEFFGLTEKQALYLFDGSSYKGVIEGRVAELRVARRIEHVLDAGFPVAALERIWADGR